MSDKAKYYEVGQVVWSVCSGWDCKDRSIPELRRFDVVKVTPCYVYLEPGHVRAEKPNESRGSGLYMGQWSSMTRAVSTPEQALSDYHDSKIAVVESLAKQTRECMKHLAEAERLLRERPWDAKPEATDGP